MIDCLKCNTRMVDHGEGKFTCLKCEARVRLNYSELFKDELMQSADIKSASELGENIKDNQI